MKHTPNQGHHQLQKGRHSIPGAYYFVTICTLNKNPILANTEVANIIFESFDWLETEARLKWFCLIVMPDHVHAVIQLQSKQSLPSVLKSFKNFTARQINTYLGNRGSLWQAAYYEHGIRQDESLVQLSTIVTRIQ